MASAGFYLLSIVFIIINIFSRAEIKTSVLIILDMVALAGFLFLIISNYLIPKDEKVYYTFCYILCSVFVLSSLVSVTLSRTKKLYLGKNFSISIFIILVTIFIIFLQIYYFQDDSGKYIKGQKLGDAGIIFGAAVWGGNRPSPVLRERINKGFEIYENGYVPILVLTGGGSVNEMTESEVARNELIKYGVPAKELIVEKSSNSTFEQILFVRDNLYKRRKWNMVIIVSDNYHLFRISEICNFNDMNTIAFASDTPLSTQGGITFCLKESIAVLTYWLLGFG